MKTQDEVAKLIKNRLMQNDQEIESFEQALNSLYSNSDIENITYFCQAFDDDTMEHEVMFSLVHGIESYDKEYGKDKTLQKLLQSLHYMEDKAKDWMETMILRILNDDSARRELEMHLMLENIDQKNIDLLKETINSLIKRNPNKFGKTGQEVLDAI